MAIESSRRGSGSAFAQPPGKLSLLSSLSFSENEGLARFNAHILEESGHIRFENNVRLTELVRQLWPGEAAEGYCKTLRLLADWTKKDFLLKPQRKGILARSDIVRAFIEPTRAVLVAGDGNPENPVFRSFLQELHNLISQRSCEECSFETSVVESIVCANVTVQFLRFQILRPVARSTLDNVRLDDSEDGVMQIFPVKAALSSFTEQIKPLVHGLSTLLHSGTEQDAPLGRIRAASTRPSRQGSRQGSFADSPQSMEVKAPGTTQLLSMSWGAPAHPHSAEIEHPELEEILENWHNAAKEVMDEAQELTSNIEDATRFLDASMSCTRNKLLRLEYIVMMPTFAMTSGNLIAGIFGMNLDKNNVIWHVPSFFKGHALFFLALAGIFCLTMLLWFGLMYIFRRSRTFYENHPARFGRNKFFTRLGDDEYVLSLVGGSKEPHETTRAISRGNSSIFDSGAIRSAVMQDLREPAVSLGSVGGRRTSHGSAFRPKTI